MPGSSWYLIHESYYITQECVLHHLGGVSLTWLVIHTAVDLIREAGKNWDMKKSYHGT